MYRLCHVHETSPGTHTLFPTYTCPVYCWRSVQLLDFGLCSNLIHASQPIRTTFTGQWFASGFLQTPPHDDALAIGCTLPTAGRVRDFHPLERALAGHTTNKVPIVNDREPCFLIYFCQISIFTVTSYTSIHKFSRIIHGKLHLTRTFRAKRGCQVFSLWHIGRNFHLRHIFF